MSDCGCGTFVTGTGIPAAPNPCTDCPPSTPDSESMASVIGNFMYWFFGTLTKTIDPVTKQVVWLLPCDLAAGIVGNPRMDGEGLACYFKRLLAEGVTGLNGTNSFATLTADFVQPAVDSTVTAVVDETSSFAANQYVWGEEGGFYLVTAVVDSTHLTLTNLKGPPDNLGAGGTVHTSKRIFVSGPAALPGPPGNPGLPGHASYLYVAYASDSVGTNFTLDPTAVTNAFIAFRVSPTVITTPLVSDFTGLWIKYKADVGPAGPTGPSGSGFPKTLVFKTAGIHSWVCPASGSNQARVRVYGAGGGGGGGASTAHGSGNGFGAGGGEYSQGIITLVPGRTYSIQVGSFGTGGTGGDSSANGTIGGDSKFYDTGTTYLLSKGGHAGGAAVGGAIGTGGTGGTGSTLPEVPNQPGLDGGCGTGDSTLGGHCGRNGAGGLGGGAGEQPGGGGGAGLGDAGGPGAVGGAGASGQVEIEIIA